MRITHHDWANRMRPCGVAVAFVVADVVAIVVAIVVANVVANVSGVALWAVPVPVVAV